MPASLSIALACDHENTIEPQHEDVLIRKELEILGHRARFVDWQSDFDWGSVDVVLLRATWNYSGHIREFEAWLDQVSTQSLLINDLELLRWNLNKKYLFELESQGVRIVPSLLVEADSLSAVGDIPEAWQSVIVKACVGAGGDQLVKLTRDQLVACPERLVTLGREFKCLELLIQPFLTSIQTYGERSLLFFGSQFSHAIQKWPPVSGFRVQVEHNGRDEICDAPQNEIEICQKVLDLLPRPPVYARFDFLFSESGECLMNEVELVEPSLYFQHAPSKAKQFVTACLNYRESRLS